MGDRLKLIRPDGSEINASPEEAVALRALGYKDETPEQAYSSAVQKTTEEHYTGVGQQLLTAGEGVASGLSLGLSDLAFGNDEMDARGQYNPGVRLGGEIVGGLLPLVPGANLLKFTPAGALIKGAEKLGAAAGGSKAVQMGVAGAAEGAGFGAQSAISQATINGDPLTVEAVMAGVGWGAVFGGGLGAMAGKATSHLEGRAAAQAAREAQVAASAEAYGTLRASVQDVTTQIDSAVKEASSRLDMAKGQLAEAGKAFDGAKRDVAAHAKTVVDEAAGIRNGAFNEVREGAGSAALAANKKAGISAFNDMKAALKAKDYAALEKAHEKFREHVANLNKDLETIAATPKFPGATPGAPMKLPVPKPAGLTNLDSVLPLEQHTLKTSEGAFKELTGLGKAAAGLKGFPTTVDGFAAMTPARAEKVAGALDTFMKGQSPEFAGLRDGLKDGIARMQDAMGMAVDGPPATQFRGLYEAARGASKKAATDTVEQAGSGVLPWARNQLGYAAGRFGSSRMGGPVGKSLAYGAARNLTMGLLGLKAAVVGGISKAAFEWAPRAAVRLGTKGSRIEPLATRLDGLEDGGTKDRQELMKLRSNEIRASAGSIRDILYKNVQPLAEEHPELAAAMHAHGVNRFKFILDKLPKDPGLAYSRLQSLWKPDRVATEKFSRYYQVFQNPVAVVKEILTTGRVLPEWAEGLREMDPALFTHLRVEMLHKLSDPAVMGKLSYPEQVSLGTLLDLPLHSTMTPQFVATQQQMYMERNTPIPMPPQPGQAGGGGRPPGASKGATSAQKITEH